MIFKLTLIHALLFLSDSLNVLADRGEGAPGTHHQGPNSFIFMQFSAKKCFSTPTLGVGTPLRKILDPPLECTESPLYLGKSPISLQIFSTHGKDIHDL